MSLFHSVLWLLYTNCVKCIVNSIKCFVNSKLSPYKQFFLLLLFSWKSLKQNIIADSASKTRTKKQICPLLTQAKWINCLFFSVFMLYVAWKRGLPWKCSHFVLFCPIKKAFSLISCVFWIKFPPCLFCLGTSVILNWEKKSVQNDQLTCSYSRISDGRSHWWETIPLLWPLFSESFLSPSLVNKSWTRDHSSNVCI